MNPLRAVAVLMLFLIGCAARPGVLPARYYGPETRLAFAVGVLSPPLRPQSASGRLRTQDIGFVLEAAR